MPVSSLPISTAGGICAQSFKAALTKSYSHCRNAPLRTVKSRYGCYWNEVLAKKSLSSRLLHNKERAMPPLPRPQHPYMITLPPRTATVAAEADVLVVGAGPAGLGAALGAAGAGVEVVLAERY